MSKLSEPSQFEKTQLKQGAITMSKWIKILRRAVCPSFKRRKKKVLLLIDWDNLFLCLYQKFGDKTRLEYRVQKLLEWVKHDIGEIACGFVFAPEHMTVMHRDMWAEHGLHFMTCPKRQLKKPERNPKSGAMESVRDTVDETLIWFGRMMMKHPDIGYICLVSGDNDYTSLMEEAATRHIKRALAPPTIGSLSKSQGLIKLVDIHPKTHAKMLLRLDTVA